MVFELTDSLAQAILYAMENQEQQFALDAARSLLVLAQDCSVDEETYYSLPRWNSGDGYNVLESFVFSLGDSNAKTELKQVLISGRGVFRNFKNVLKSYPEIDRRWHVFKDKRLRARLMEWYNALRESWGLALLSQDFDEYDELTEQDFTFSAYNPDKDADCVVKQSRAIADELEKSLQSEVGQAAALVWQNHSATVPSHTKSGFVCRSLTEEFAGCILVSFCPSSAKKTVVITDFFVAQNYRSLGIARELLTLCFSRLKECGVQWCIVDLTIPPQLDSLFARLGFERKGTISVADVTKV